METRANLLLENPKPFVLYLIALGGCDKYIASVRIQSVIVNDSTPFRSSCSGHAGE
jgi:hypothetical protein